jgi:hypothetical protein
MGVRMLQGDRIAFGEDIARADVADFLAAVAAAAAGQAPDPAGGFSPGFEPRSLIGATLEIYNDGRLPPRVWGHAGDRLRSDA